MVLDRIERPNDIKKINPAEYSKLASEIREFLIDKISVTGGHLASNLGVVELTMALHLFLNLPKDKLIWDVGHQSYTHKLLTGRKERFDSLRLLGGMSGFPNRNECSCDAFNTGHSSTSISAGLGIAQARELLGEDYKVVSVIGDGALTGGLAYEALNNASQLKSNFIIVLNDNEMSISENIGGVSRMLSSIRTDPSYMQLKDRVKLNLMKLPGGGRLVRGISSTKQGIKQLVIPGMLFEDMDLTYVGPVDGHDIQRMVDAFNNASRVKGAVVVHVKTQKGRGYAPAEEQPEKYHGVNPFIVKTGEPREEKTGPSYADIFSGCICEMAKQDPKVCAVTAAMAPGVGLSRFRKAFPDRFFDVGIAEQHATTFSAGLASGGMKPYFAVYSSFLQRAYDQIISDVCLQDMNVKLCIDRSGIVGNDGETHQGLFDLSYLLPIPNMSIFAPKNAAELKAILDFSMNFEGPLAIRYPRGKAWFGMEEFNEPICYGRAEVLYRERKTAILAVGSMVRTAAEVREELKKRGMPVTLVNVRFVKPFDRELLRQLSDDHDTIITMEENVLAGGFGEHIAAICAEEDMPFRIIPIGIPNTFIEHGGVKELKRAFHLDAEGVLSTIGKELIPDEAET